MIKPVTGQYECAHSSKIGLDYFTSRLDRLVLQANGSFTLIVQDRSRLANAAQSLINGQQLSTAAPETKREGTYTLQGTTLTLHFDDGGSDQGQLSWNGEGIQFGKNFFNKVSDSTLLPPTHRVKKDMEDIAKGLKIAGTLGSMAMKAAKTIHETLQPTPPANQQQPSTSAAPQQPAQVHQPPQQSMPVQPASPPQPVHNPAPPQPTQEAPGQSAALFCDQCGARARPGKRFCNNCGARLV